MPDLFILEPDINHWQEGFSLLKKLRMWPRLAVKCVVILPKIANRLADFEALDISGVVCTECLPDELEECLATLAAGYRYQSPHLRHSIDIRPIRPLLTNQFTSREREVFALLAQGFTNKEIATQLFVSVKTVETHKLNLIQKLNLTTTRQLQHLAMDSVRYPVSLSQQIS